MWPFRPSPDSDLVTYLCQLMQYQNTLLLELLSAQGLKAPLLPPRPRQTRAVGTPRTEKDVIRVTREEVIAQERIRQANRDAPWRDPIPPQSGQGSAGTGSTSGSTSSTVAAAGPDS